MKGKILLLLIACTSLVACVHSAEGRMELRKARGGDAEAQLRIGINYGKGTEGFPKNYRKARKWIYESVCSGYVEAQYVFGECLRNNKY